MKKIVCILALLSIAVMSFSSCDIFCSHEWKEATCTQPKTCSLCNKTEGTVESTAHNWSEATCKVAKTCRDCGVVEGDPLPTHTFEYGECIYCEAIELNLFNYKDYLNCSAYASAEYPIYWSGYGYYYLRAECEFKVTGNSHYKYTDVRIVIEFSYYDKEGYKQHLISCLNPNKEDADPYDTGKCIVYLNLAGNGSDTCTLSVPGYDYAKSSDVTTRTLFNVVSVSGVVEEY